MDNEELRKEIDEIVFETRFNHIDHHETVGKLLTLFDKHKKPSRKQKTIEERKDSFIEKLSPYTEKYSAGLIMEFLSYWTEANDGAKKMRFEMKKNQPFNIGRRLGTWKMNQKKYGNNDNGNSNTGQISAWQS